MKNKKMLWLGLAAIMLLSTGAYAQTTAGSTPAVKKHVRHSNKAPKAPKVALNPAGLKKPA